MIFPTSVMTNNPSGSEIFKGERIKMLVGCSVMVQLGLKIISMKIPFFAHFDTFYGPTDRFMASPTC